MPGTPGPRTGLAQVNPTGESPTILRTTANAIISWLEANAMLTSAGLLADRPVSTPGSPGISGRRYYATDTGVEYRDTGTGWLALGVELVTALPAAPYNGQIVDYLADATNGVVWRLRYRSVSASAYKWEVIGTSPLTQNIPTLETTTNTGYVDLATTGPQVTVPLAGDYLITLTVQGGNSAAGDGISATVKLGAAGAADGESVAHTSAIANATSTVSRTMRRNGIAAAALLKTQYRALSTGTATFLRRELAVSPIRVG